MDPNEALSILRAQVRAIFDDDGADVVALADTFEALDGWLTRGGFLPTDWQANR